MPNGNRRNPRQHNRSRRIANARRLRAEGRTCWICEAFGRPSRIDYALPPGQPGSFEVDEYVPVSRYWLGGYPSPEACADDYENLGAVHRRCNQWCSNKSVAEVMRIAAAERGVVEASADGLPQPW